MILVTVTSDDIEYKEFWIHPHYQEYLLRELDRLWLESRYA